MHLAIIRLENQFFVFLRVADKDRFTVNTTPLDNSMYILKPKHGNGLNAAQSVIKQLFPHFTSKIP